VRHAVLSIIIESITFVMIVKLTFILIVKNVKLTNPII